METITLTTSDNVKIAADYWQGTVAKGIVLLHMMPATRSSWMPFVHEFLTHGFHILTIDLRGHGESEGGPEEYLSFKDADHKKSIHDIEAAVTFLRKKDISELSIAGASIGANLALWYAAEHRDIHSIALLSAGLNYKGIAAESFAKNLSSGQRIFFVSSEEDERSPVQYNGKEVTNNAEMNRVLYDAVPENVEKKLLAYKTGGHGTDMFYSLVGNGLERNKTDLIEKLIAWLTAK